MLGHDYYIDNTGKSSLAGKKLLLIISTIFIFIAGLMIFQDYLEASRNGYSFYFTESLLFKTIYLLFIPILMILFRKISKKKLDSLYTTSLFIIGPVLFHYLLLPIVFLLFSILFFGGRYDLYKILTYTLANDLYILILVYSSFVLGYKYLSKSTSVFHSDVNKTWTKTLVINHGKGNSIVNVSEISLIIAATPYVEIYLETKKFLKTASLKSTHQLLDPDDFVRVHKSTIVNINKILFFKSRLNGDYDLHLKDGQITRLSRTYASNFKKRYDITHRVRE